MLMDQFLTAAEREGLLPFGAEVCRNGKVTEHWEQTPGRRYPVYSAAKSFTSTAVGLAVDEGKMALEDPLEKFFPQELDRAGGTSGDLWRQVTIRRLLTMTVPGLPFRPSGEDWLMDCFSRTFDIGRGTEFSYSTLPAYLAGVTVERAVGEHTADYLERKLFVPLEIPRPPMQLCPKGHFYGATGMELTAHELGMLLACDDSGIKIDNIKVIEIHMLIILLFIFASSRNFSINSITFNTTYISTLFASAIILLRPGTDTNCE